MMLPRRPHRSGATFRADPDGELCLVGYCETLFTGLVDIRIQTSSRVDRDL